MLFRTKENDTKGYFTIPVKLNTRAISGKGKIILKVFKFNAKTKKWVVRNVVTRNIKINGLKTSKFKPIRRKQVQGN